MKHLVLDVNAVLDLWLNRQHADLIEELLTIDSNTCMTWISASSIPALTYVAKRELKSDGATPEEAGAIVNKLLALLLDNVNILSNFSWHMADNHQQCSDIENAQIALAASELHNEAMIDTAAMKGFN